MKTPLVRRGCQVPRGAGKRNRVLRSIPSTPTVTGARCGIRFVKVTGRRRFGRTVNVSSRVKLALQIYLNSQNIITPKRQLNVELPAKLKGGGRAAHYPTQGPQDQLPSQQPALRNARRSL
jgi:hypothetical protein